MDGGTWRDPGFAQTDEHPVVEVIWHDTVAFLGWLSRKEGKTYRLPTEAEWEYACRAGTTTGYYHGDDPERLAEVGNVADAAAKAKFAHWTWTISANDGYVFTAPVGRFKADAWGLYDMHGNAWEWCADWDEWDRNRPDEPAGVLRGGSWNFSPLCARSAYRLLYPPTTRFRDFGFRVALDPAEKGEPPKDDK